MAPPRWRLTWTWAGVSGSISDVAPDFTRRADLYGGASGVLSVGLRVQLRGIRSVAATVAAGVPLYTGTADLYLGDELVVSGRWSADSTYGADGEPLSLVLEEALDSDTGVWPPIGDAPTLGTDRLIDGALGIRPGIVTSRTWPVISPSSQGAGYPVVIGTPGTSDLPGAPAPVISDGSATAISVMAHAGPAAGTVTVWGPTRVADDAGGTTAPTLTSYTATLSTATDRLGCVVVGDTFSSTAVGKPGWSPGGASYYTSWDGTASGLPSGAGDLLALALERSSLRVDVGSVRSARPLLNRYVLAGYVDDRVPPLEWVQAVLLPILPASLTPGPAGLELAIWPWLDTPDAVALRLRADVGFSRASAVGYTSRSAPGAVRVLGAWCPSEGRCMREATASARDLLAARTASAGPRGGLESVETRIVWDAATLARVARDRLLAAAVRRTVAYQCDPTIYGPGGRLALRIGMPILLTDDAIRLSGAAAVIRSIEHSGSAMRVQVDLRDDGMHATG